MQEYSFLSKIIHSKFERHGILPFVLLFPVDLKRELATYFTENIENIIDLKNMPLRVITLSCHKNSDNFNDMF